jgi:hypothetical protein
MGLDISAYSHLRFHSEEVPEEWDYDRFVYVYEVDGFDRLDGKSSGLYEQTELVHVWWHEEHGTHAIPDTEVKSIEGRIAALRAGSKAECPGDLAVLAANPPVTESHGFRAGSYSGYNWWREQLCQLALGVPPSEVWEDPDAHAGKPFLEMINFSDAEGAIGPVTSAKLAKDFAINEARLVTLAEQRIADPDEREYFTTLLSDWRHAFELAAKDGFVIFH